MSDLRSEIVSKVLNSWERPEAQPVKQSFGMQVFNYVKDHPYCTIAEVKEALDASDTQSTASTLKTLIDKGIIGREEKPVRAYQGFGRRTQYEYFAVSETYEAVNKGYWKA
jgi:predicted transcriptional regulator